ncbi:zinc finger protein 333-like [Helicoverpa zea]|uniref:zinc finger protein 333-like n=1 Tax=Helicoverpa zea TaxID=7113 RepID=UPI001F569920|nr:zinc finger protein 333-like [Helicoverpa zea]
MAESDGDIEYLDEDADIVQQCVQVVPVQVPHLVPRVVEKPSPLLVERMPAERKRKKRKDEEDSDYDPNDDLLPPSPPSSKGKKKRQNVVKKVKTYQRGEGVQNLKVGSSSGRKAKHFPAKEPVIDRKLCNIRIPDYDDPLCLPVKAIKSEDSDVKRLNNWNNVCLEHFKHCDSLLKPERGDTYSSVRTVVFRNVANKQTGKPETTIWSKTCVENDEGDKKSEIFQCVLPRYKEKKVLTTFNLAARRPKPFHLSDEVILSKEDSKDGEVLVVYKPKEASSAVYKMVTASDRKSSEGKEEDSEDKEDDDDFKMYMKELAFCKMCAPCFQTSWRGVKKNTRKSIACPICSRSFVTVYNLLSHFKTHSTEDMQKYKTVISSILAEIVDYHYKCRVCREQFPSIKNLRQHVTTHQGNEFFTCEVGNHLAR